MHGLNNQVQSDLTPNYKHSKLYGRLTPSLYFACVFSFTDPIQVKPDSLESRLQDLSNNILWAKNGWEMREIKIKEFDWTVQNSEQSHRNSTHLWQKHSFNSDIQNCIDCNDCNIKNYNSNIRKKYNRKLHQNNSIATTKSYPSLN